MAAGQEHDLLLEYGSQSYSSYRLTLNGDEQELALRFEGRLAEAVPESFVTDVLTRLQQAQQWRLAIELEQCEHISSVALSFVVRVVRAVSERGACAVAIGASPHVAGLIEVLGLRGVLIMASERSEAERLFAERGY